MTTPIITVRDLGLRYRGKEASAYALQGVSFDLEPGKVLALVGESGSGKTTAGLAILQLLPPNAEFLSGEVLFLGRNLLSASPEELRRIRGRRIAMVFQDPVSGLNPVITIGDQVAEILISHLQIGKKEAKQRAVDLLHEVGLAEAGRLARAYPFQLSGGMCQRVMIAIATALNPEVLIADEPTSSLDVTVQAQILDQLDQLRRLRGTSILLITHDFGVVAQMADDVAVLYAGRVVEAGATEEVMATPLHPYSAALLGARPRLDSSRGPLRAIPGHLPEMNEVASRCPFLPRCAKAVNACRGEPPPVLSAGPGANRHAVACYNPVWHASLAGS